MEGFCKGCLIKYDDPTDLLQYTEKNRRLYIYATGLQVKRNDSFTFQLCKDCYVKMKLACTFKKQCRNSDKRYKNYLALKEAGDTADFCSFLKNNDDSLMFRFPLISGNSTPAAQRARDEDNESTCTSIRNFMSDILRVEELPDTEARIIREVIEEEADVLDDSLDSHWLQDDASIDTDFRLDFSISPFSTPRSVNNDYCFTPRKLRPEFGPDEDELMNNLTSAVEMQASKRNETYNLKENNQMKSLTSIEDMLQNPLQNKAGHLASKNKQIKSPTTIEEMIRESLQKDTSNLKSNNKEIRNLTTIEEMIQEPLQNDISNLKSNNKEIRSLTTIEEMIQEPLRNDSSNLKSNNKEIRSLTTIEEMIQEPLQNDTSNDKSNNKEIRSLPTIEEMLEGPIQNDTVNKNKEIKSLITIEELLQAPLKNEMDTLTIKNKQIKACTEPRLVNYYVENNELNNDFEISKRELMGNHDCQIDRNLKEALKNDNKKEYALDDLLVTPPNNEVGPFFNSSNTDYSMAPSSYLWAKIYRGSSAPSTPTITNILFGDKLDSESTYMNTPRPGECIEKYADIEGDIDIMGDFFYKEPEKDCIERENEEFEIEKEQEKIKETECEYDLVKCFCKLCDKKFKSEKALRIHFCKYHHSRIAPNKRTYVRKYGMCDYCGKYIADRRNFTQHMKLHTKSKKPEDNKCKYCHMEFSAPSKLRIHMTIHIGKTALEPRKRNYVCNTCGATATSAGNLKMHERRHTNKYLYYCDCGKGYFRKSDLERHARRHTGVKPFTCKDCDKSFTRSDILSRHIMKRHSVKRDFKCDYCDIAFATSRDLNGHMKRSKRCLKNRFGSALQEYEEYDQSISNPDKTILYVLKEDAELLAKTSKKNNQEIQPNTALQ